VLFLQDAVQQRGLTAAEKAGEDGDGNLVYGGVSWREFKQRSESTHGVAFGPVGRTRAQPGQEGARHAAAAL